MTWAKLDDRWATHPKLLAAGLEAKGLDASGICYSAGQETDGFIPDRALKVLAAGHRDPHKVARRLIEVGRWRRDDERRGYVIHDFDKYNFTREQGEAKRKRDAERKAAARRRQGRDDQGRIIADPEETDPEEGDSCGELGECPHGIHADTNGECTSQIHVASRPSTRGVAETYSQPVVQGCDVTCMPDPLSPAETSECPRGFHPVSAWNPPPVRAPRPDPTRPLLNKSSSNHQVRARKGAEEEELGRGATAAVRLLAERRLATRDGPPIKNPSGWLRKVGDQIQAEHGGALVALEAEGLSPQAMADRIMAPPVSTVLAHQRWEPSASDEPVTDLAVARQRLADLRSRKVAE